MPLVNGDAGSSTRQKAPATASETHGAGKEGCAKALANLVEDIANNPQDEVTRLKEQTKKMREDKNHKELEKCCAPDNPDAETCQKLERRRLVERVAHEEFG